MDPGNTWIEQLVWFSNLLVSTEVENRTSQRLEPALVTPRRRSNDKSVGPKLGYQMDF